MRTENILNILKNKDVVIPSFLIKYYKEININEKELIFLSFLISCGEKIPFDLENISLNLNMEIEELMMIISSLTDKKLLDMIVSKNKNGIIEEYLDINLLYAKILGLILNEKEQEEEKVSDIYSIIENEFGRTLSPIEYETIKKWLDSNIKEELIMEALKEAVLNGVNNLKYIDKILYEWNKKGYKKSNDIKKNKPREEKVEIFDYDWLEDNEEH